MPESIPLVTSLDTRDIENQQVAVASWLRLGFSAVSLNAPADIEALKPHFDNVAFVPVQGGAIAFDAVVGFLQTQAAPVCGVIKPDIHLRASPGALQLLIDEARGSLVYASRTDVASLEEATGDIRKSGFDVFLFDRNVVASLPSTELRLGRGWWDLWLPYCLMRARGCALKFAAFPFAFCRTGVGSRVEEADYKKYGLYFAEFMDPGARAALLAQPAELLDKSLEAMQMNMAMAILFESRWLSCFPE